MLATTEDESSPLFIEYGKTGHLYFERMKQGVKRPIYKDFKGNILDSMIKEGFELETQEKFNCREIINSKELNQIVATITPETNCPN